MLPLMSRNVYMTFRLDCNDCVISNISNPIQTQSRTRSGCLSRHRSNRSSTSSASTALIGSNETSLFWRLPARLAVWRSGSELKGVTRVLARVEKFDLIDKNFWASGDQASGIKGPGQCFALYCDVSVCMCMCACVQICVYVRVFMGVYVCISLIF